MSAIDLSVLPPRRRLVLTWTGGAAALLVVLILLVIFTFHDYGVTWDEDVHNWYGVFVLDYYLSAFMDSRALHWQDLINYGAAFDMTAALINRISPFGTYETRHLLNGLTGILGLVGVWKAGRFLAGPRAGLFAAVLLATIPNYYGQMYNNPKDIPFAVGCIWALYYLCRIVAVLPRPPASLVLKLGIAVGMSLGVRVGGLLLLAYAGLAGSVFCLWRGIETRSVKIALSEGWTGIWRGFLPMLAISYPVMLLFWPWAQQDPIEHPLSALATFSHETFPFKTLFAGQYFPATDLPWEYLPTHIVLALPELTMLLALAGLPAAMLREWYRPGGPDRTRSLQILLIATAILFPVCYAVTIKAVLFDGMRHFIFVLPPIALVAGLVADGLFERLRHSRYRPVLLAALGLYGLGHISIMVLLHPDEYVYYNGFIGGVKGAEQLFKTDYWANSYAEAVEGLTNYLETEYGAEFEEHDFTVAVCGPPVSAKYFFPDNLVFTNDRTKADFFIAFTKDNCDKSLPGQEVFRVERMGVLLSLVLDRRDYVAGRQPAALKPPEPSAP
jgi:Dolichyl-phosphate-mannose-protein mannosyltransferase